ncbi:uncharacterized protein EI90DRAFT_194794 [Cantharellus anzutake]|uniref:uncharacterized protein n=1 Tax=Cantharellus anzutake TaxID=1750568 RepID=UPI001904D2B6|nr:uncharacterized protein EI90DRAFT_194794 [Cantharellus anzutake]KAF8336584.1 hypothetical protein EI90DRAFT_194794 [Cantharellus anzutake]
MPSDVPKPIASLAHPTERWEELFLEQFAMKEKASLKARISELERKVSDSELIIKNLKNDDKPRFSYSDDTPLVLCLLDGDRYIPSEDYLSQGSEGGRKFAARLSQNIFAHIGRKNVQLVTMSYYNHRGLMDALNSSRACYPREFNDFVNGFNQSTPLFTMTDVGHGKEAADAKIRDMLILFARLPQTRRVYFGGGHDGGYATVLRSMDIEGLLDKVVIIQGYSRLARAIEDLRLPRLVIDGLFLRSRLNTRDYFVRHRGRSASPGNWSRSSEYDRRLPPSRYRHRSPSRHSQSLTPDLDISMLSMDVSSSDEEPASSIGANPHRACTRLFVLEIFID